jgi:hypothetical protein
METNSPANPRERIFLLKKLPGFQNLPFPNQDHGPLDILARRTPFVARRNLIIKPRPKIPPAPGFVPGHGGERDGLVRHILFTLEYDLLGHFHSLKLERVLF